MTEQITIDGRETAMLLWAIAHIGDRPEREPSGTNDPLFVLLACGYERKAIMATAAQIEQFVMDDVIPLPLTDIQKISCAYASRTHRGWPRSINSAGQAPATK